MDSINEIKIKVKPVVFVHVEPEVKPEDLPILNELKKVLYQKAILYTKESLLEKKYWKYKELARRYRNRKIKKRLNDVAKYYWNLARKIEEKRLELTEKEAKLVNELYRRGYKYVETSSFHFIL